MNNQIFLQPDFTVEKTHDEDILHTLIQAQLRQSLSEIEALIDAPIKLSDEKSFKISHGNKDANEDLQSPKGIRRVFSIFRWFKTWIM